MEALGLIVLVGIATVALSSDRPIRLAALIIALIAAMTIGILEVETGVVHD